MTIDFSWKPGRNGTVLFKCSTKCQPRILYPTENRKESEINTFLLKENKIHSSRPALKTLWRSSYKGKWYQWETSKLKNWRKSNRNSKNIGKCNRLFFPLSSLKYVWQLKAKITLLSDEVFNICRWHVPTTVLRGETKGPIWPEVSYVLLEVVK